MAKRARGSIRPGQRRPQRRRPTAPAKPESGVPATPAKPASGVPAAPPPSGGLTEAEAARASELEAQLLAEERAAEDARRRSRERVATARDVAPAGALSTQVDEEYAYVARDVRDIVRVGGLLLGILFLLWILIDVTGTIPIG